MKRSLRYTGRFRKDPNRLDAAAHGRILLALERFAESGDGDFRPLRGECSGSYRLRVGMWRVFLLIVDMEITAYRIDNRGDAS
jgi:mRNA-degrading endonuclease RelE of RelBE toxin-antitoxin system